MELDILDSLDELGYPGTLCKEKALKEAIELGTKSVEFMTLVSWLSQELQVLLQLEAVISPIEDTTEPDIFLLEISSFLKELHCPYSVIMTGPVHNRLDDSKKRCILLNYLCTELQAARMLEFDGKKQKTIQMDSSPIATSLSKVSKALNVKVLPSENIQEYFLKLYGIVNEMISKHPEFLHPPIINAELSKAQWERFEEQIVKDMHSDYKTRRAMLLTRLDVTIQSFKWSDQMKGKEEKVNRIFLPMRSSFKEEPNVGISDLLAAREGITIIEKTSCGAFKKNNKSIVNKVIIGKLPDRGGRPKEQKPPVEMPDFKIRTQPQEQRSDHSQRGGYRKNPQRQQNSGYGGRSQYSNTQHSSGRY